MKRKLLEGIRVIDFTRYIAGPLTTKHLSDLGAEVIRIESKRALDPQRNAPTASFNQYNTGKLSISLNVATAKGLELAKRLIVQSDIVVENFAGGSMEKMGLGYEVLKDLKQDIIVLSCCMQGQTGPLAKHPGLGFQLTALVGINNILGWPDREMGWLGAYTDFVVPLFGSISIMAALEYRHRTGKGMYLDLSQFEVGLQFIAPLILEYAVNKHIASRIGNKYPNAAPHNAYRCLGEDRWCAISVFTDEEWKSFCTVIGNPTWTTDPRFATLLARKENEDELDTLINEWTSRHSAEEVMKMMQEAEIAAGVVETGEDLLDKDLQLKHRGTFIELEHPEAKRYRTQSGPRFLLSKYKYEVKRAPLLGEHNEYVFKKILGLQDSEYDQLIKDGIIY